MFDGVTARLEQKKLEMLRKVAEETEAKEKRLLEMEQLEDKIEKSNEVKKRRTEKKINRMKKLRNMILGKEKDNFINTENKINDKEIRKKEAEKNFNGFAKQFERGNENSICQKNSIDSSKDKD